MKYKYPIDCNVIIIIIAKNFIMSGTQQHNVVTCFPFLLYIVLVQVLKYILAALACDYIFHNQNSSYWLKHVFLYTTFLTTFTVCNTRTYIYIQYATQEHIYIYIYSTMMPNIKGTDSSIFSLYSTPGTTFSSIFSGCCS